MPISFSKVPAGFQFFDYLVVCYNCTLFDLLSKINISYRFLTKHHLFWPSQCKTNSSCSQVTFVIAKIISLSFIFCVNSVNFCLLSKRTSVLPWNYPERWIGRGKDAPIHWPLRSPDLNPYDFTFGDKL